MPNFTVEDIRMLAKAERDMDSGAAPFVMLEGQRWLMTDEAMKEFELTTGQTVNHVIILKILEYNLSCCQAQSAINKAQANSA